MNKRGVVVLGMVGTLFVQGCAGRNFTGKPWTWRSGALAAACAAAGAGGGYGIAEGTRGNSQATIKNADGSVARHIEVKDDLQYGYIIGGALIGAGLCAVAGHYFLDPEVDVPPPPPTPNPEGVPPPSAKRLVLRGINFDFNENSIRPDSRPILDEAADVLSVHPRVRLSVEGHTDYIGSDAYNEKLSVRRAEAVFRYLTNRGVSPTRMEVIGYGKSRPLTENDDEEGRAQNRRVELHVVNPDAAEGVVDAPVTAPGAPAPVVTPAPPKAAPAAAVPAPTKEETDEP